VFFEGGAKRGEGDVGVAFGRRYCAMVEDAADELEIVAT
jgi:hypothetical protein